ncbi:MAG: hypothetical protein HY681_11290 [Chloroflexi bacterium]|nr:hypothetical protein [Chloroflexota bacterium]
MAEQHEPVRRRRRRRATSHDGLGLLGRARRIVVIFIALGGLAFSSFVAFAYFAGATPPCFIGDGCLIITDRQYATLYGVPIALVGIAGYGLVFCVAYGWVLPRYGGLLLYLLSLAALTLSVYLAYVETVVAGAACSYCQLSYGLAAGQFVALMSPTAVISGVPWKRHRLLALSVIASVALLAVASR